MLSSAKNVLAFISGRSQKHDENYYAKIGCSCMCKIYFFHAFNHFFISFYALYWQI